MSTVDPSQIPNIVTDIGIRAMAEAYAAEAPVHPMLFDVREVSAVSPPEGYAEAVVSGGKVPDKTPRGAPAPARSMEEAFTWQVAIHKYQELMEIPEEVYADPNALGIITEMVQRTFRGWGQGWAIRKERRCADIFNNGRLSAGHLATFDQSYTNRPATYPKFIYDGKPFLAASGNGHPLALQSSTTKYNLVASGALTNTNLEAARILMEDTNAYDEAGDRISVRATCLVVPPALSQTARVLLNSELLPGTAQNDVNTFADGAIRPMVWRYLTDTDGWILHSRTHGGLVAFDSGELMRIVTSAPDKATGNVSVRAAGYFGAGVKDWRCAVAYNMATS